MPAMMKLSMPYENIEHLSHDHFDEYEGIMDAWEGYPHQSGRSDAYDAGYALEYARQQQDPNDDKPLPKR